MFLPFPPISSLHVFAGARYVPGSVLLSKDSGEISVYSVDRALVLMVFQGLAVANQSWMSQLTALNFTSSVSKMKGLN